MKRAAKRPRCSGPCRHFKECRPGRPLCRWRRRLKGICTCTAYPYPHRDGGGACKHGEIPAVVLRSPSYLRAHLPARAPEIRIDVGDSRHDLSNRIA